MSPSGIVCAVIFTVCFMAGASSGHWFLGAVAGIVAAVGFVVLVDRLLK